MKIKFLFILFLLLALSTELFADKKWSTTSLPESSFILLQYNKTELYACDTDGCNRIKLPFKYGIVTQNFKDTYRLFQGFGDTVSEQTVKAVWKWNPSKGTIRKYSVTVGNKKWPEYSQNATHILADGTVIGEFMVSGRRNMGYAKQPGKKERPLSQFWRHRGSHHYIFRPNGSYLAIDAPGTMRQPTAPFTNQVRGYPQVIYQGSSLFAKARKLSSGPAYSSVHFLNNYNHVSYWKLGRYKGDSNSGDWRKLLVEILDTKTGRKKVIGDYHDNLGPPDFKDIPRILNFRLHPYLMYEYKLSDGAYGGIRQYFKFYNLKTGRSHKINFNGGYSLIGTFNLDPIMYSQSTFTDTVVLGKRSNNRLYLRVVRMPNQEVLLETSTDRIDAGGIDDGSLFYNLIKADYIVKGANGINNRNNNGSNKKTDKRSNKSDDFERFKKVFRP